MPKIVTRAADPKASRIQEYVLISGKHFAINEDGDEIVYSVGERVPLTRAEFNAFKDKFREVAASETKEPEKEPAKEPAKTQGTTQTQTQTQTKPQGATT